MARFPWLKLRKKTEEELPFEPPIWMGNHSNGEYFHTQTPAEAKMREMILQKADDQSRYLGMDRREFLASTMGMATTLAVINQVTGCKGSDEGNGNLNSTAPYVTPVEACSDETNVLDADKEFIFDIQTHSFDDGEWREKNIVYPTFLNFMFSGGCSDVMKPKLNRASGVDCMDRNRYGELMFVDSDTSMTVITSWPAASCFPERELLGNAAGACGLPLSNEAMRDLRDWFNTTAMSERVINQVQVMPNDVIERQIDGMHAAMEDPNWRAGSWKAYPAWRSDTYPSSNGQARGYFLTDPIGHKFIQTGLSLGVPNFAVHKGLPIPGFDVEHNFPWDIGPISVDYPEANFVVYHSAISAGYGDDPLSALSTPATETGPYDPDAPKESLKGTDTLLRSLQDSGVMPGSNVYAELGSAWSNVMRNAVNAQHFMGKLLKHVGEDNICWGTDCILGGSPQAQIEAFRLFTITPEFQQMYGYPELTPAIKKKIFGLNAAKFYRIDPEKARCKMDTSQFAMLRREIDGELGDRRWTVKPPLGPTTRREFMNMARINRAKGSPG
jgi:hypothetical protein